MSRRQQESRLSPIFYGEELEFVNNSSPRMRFDQSNHLMFAIFERTINSATFGPQFFRRDAGEQNFGST
jgi:hypothetical protein